MAIQSLYPAIKPSLNLDFANSKKLDPRITFTRASGARYYDGKTVAKAEENLLLRSQDLDITQWTANANNISVSANTADTTAPDGSVTAEKLTDNATNGAHRLLVVNSLSFLIGGVTFTLSVFLKKGTNNFAYIGFRDGGTTDRYIAAAFDLDLGTAGDTFNPGSGTLVGSTITPVRDGWYRCTVTGSLSGSANTNPGVIIGMATTAVGLSLGGFVVESYVGTGSTLYAWGAQLEQRSSVTAYTATTTQQITNYIPALQAATDNVARFDHSPTTGESLGLLIEEQRTNLLTRSEEFDAADWTKTRSSIVANTIIAPDGTLTGSKLVEDTTASNTHQIARSISYTSGVTYTRSMYAKAGERTNFRFQLPSAAFTAAINARFDVLTGEVVSVTSPGVASIVPVGNGWYRCSVTATATATTTTNEISCGLYQGNNTSYTGDDFSGIYIWGAQLEAGAFPTSYIPTTSATATRSADAASMTGANFSSWFNPDGGAVYVEAASPGSGTRVAFGMDNDATGNRFEVYSSTLDPKFLVRSGGTDQADIDAGSITAGTAFRFAAAYAVNDFGASVNGGAAVTDTSGILPVGVDRARIGAGQAGNALNARIRKISYYPARLSNANLQALTT